MTEAEWLACEDWRPLVDFIAPRLTKRQATLYVCAGLRRLWYLLYSNASRKVVEVVERAADGQATEEEVSSAYWGAECPTFGFDFSPDQIRKAQWVEWNPDIQRLLEMGVYTKADILHSSDDTIGDQREVRRLLNLAIIAESVGAALEGRLLEQLEQARDWPGGWLVREVVGSPFTPTALRSDWLTPAVGDIARGAYDGRELPDGTIDAPTLGILADALEDAGCADAGLLGHLRSAGPHVRGCWALDLVLGKS